ncbi:hypothetical protein ACTSKR_16635 [Chitinibacteraceae bacterium HSL-7]
MSLVHYILAGSREGVGQLLLETVNHQAGHAPTKDTLLSLLEQGTRPVIVLTHGAEAGAMLSTAQQHGRCVGALLFEPGPLSDQPVSFPVVIAAARHPATPTRLMVATQQAQALHARLIVLGNGNTSPLTELRAQLQALSRQSGRF